MKMPTPETISAYATMASTAIAAVALIVAGIQILAGQRSAHEAMANQAYQSYLRNCSERPHLGDWFMFKKWSGIKKARILFENPDLNAESYLWFISELLNMCDLVLRSTRVEKWRWTLGRQISYHLPVFQYCWNGSENWRSSYSRNVVALVDDVLAHPGYYR